MHTLTLLLPLVLAISGVVAYDLYGGYERILFYSVYRLDYDAKDGDPKKMAIGTGCKSPTGRKPCDLLDFVQYINESPTRPVLRNFAADFDWKDIKPDDVHKIAKEMRDADVTGFYHPGKIHKDVGRTEKEVDKMLEFVGLRATAYMEDDKLSANARTCAKDAVTSVENLRRWENRDRFRKMMNERWNINIEPMRYRHGLVDIDRMPTDQESMQRIIAMIDEKARAKTPPERYTARNLKADLKAYEDSDDGHFNKRQAALRAKTCVVDGYDPGCTRKPD